MQENAVFSLFFSKKLPYFLVVLIIFRTFAIDKRTTFNNNLKLKVMTYRWNETVNVTFTVTDVITKEVRTSSYVNVLRKNIGSVLSDLIRDAKLLKVCSVTITSNN